MHILIVTPFTINSCGGVTTVVHNLARTLHELGHHVTILARGNSQRWQYGRCYHQHAVYSIDWHAPYHTLPHYRAFAYWLLIFPRLFLQTWLLLRRLRPEAILIQYPCRKLYLFGFLKPLLKCPLVVTFQGCDARHYALLPDAQRSLITNLLKHADFVTAVSPTMLDFVHAALPAVQSKSLVIPNAISPSSPATEALNGQSPHAPSDYLLFVGSLIKRKGVDILLQALRRVRDNHRPLTLYLAGDGPERPALEAQAREFGIDGLLRFLGRQPPEEVAKLMAHCRLLILPSRAEGMPLVVLEAMSQGKAVIATAVDGTPLAVQHLETGLLVEPENPAALADAIVLLDRDDSLRHKLERAAREFVLREYNWPKIAGQYLALVNSKNHEPEFVNSCTPDGAVPELVEIKE